MLEVQSWELRSKSVYWEDLLFVLTFFVLIPGSLAVRAWRRYRLLGYVKGRELLLLRIALIFASLSLGVLAVFSTLVNLGPQTSKLLPNWGTMTLSIFNLPLTMGSLIISLASPKTTPESVSVKNHVIGISIYLSIIWLFLMGH